MAFPAVASDMRSRLSAADMIGEEFISREYAPRGVIVQIGLDGATER